MDRTPNPPRQAGGTAPARTRRSRRRRHLYPLLALGVVVVLLGTSLIGAATTPGNENFESKWADWMRSHHGAAIVAPVERLYYSRQEPGKGGRPASLNALPAAGGGTVPAAKAAATRTPAPAKAIPTPTTVPATVPATPTTPAHLQPPSPVPLVVRPALSGEGEWLPVGPTVGGVPAMYEAQFRADRTYTGQITSAVWIDPNLFRLSLVPGAQEPGGIWPVPPDLSGSAALHAVAAFNGGFRVQDAHGGFYLDGHEQVPLVDGAASLVIDDDGRVDIGTWGHEVSMTPHVVAVLQNLVPIVDHGRPAPTATYKDASIWGGTLGYKTVTARSAVGVTADGALVYVAGPALSAKSLAESLQRAGVVRGMALDLNPEWVTFNFFSHDAVGNVTGVKLYPQMLRPADRYLGPTPESRDFFVVSDPS